MKKIKRDTDIFYMIPTSLAGIFVGITILFLIFAKESLSDLTTIIGGLVALGIVAMFFAYKLMKKK